MLGYRRGVPSPFRLATDGDDLERRCWPLFIRREFPSYERYWYRFVAPLTNRDKNRRDVHFKSEEDLAAMVPRRGYFDLYLAQLNYSVVWHLSAVFEMRAAGGASRWDSQLFVGAVVRLCSAFDVAEEFQQRVAQGDVPDDPWGQDAMRARSAWRKLHPRPEFLEQLQRYRHQLIHSGPFMHWAEGPFFPKVGRHAAYTDWRKATSVSIRELPDFDHASAIVEEAWDATLKYLEASWQQVLVGRGAGRTRPPSVRPHISPHPADGTRTTTDPSISFAQADPVAVTYIDSLVGTRVRNTTTEPAFRLPTSDSWNVPVSGSGSSVTPSAPVLSGSMPEDFGYIPETGANPERVRRGVKRRPRSDR